ncbi:MAG: ATP-binding protein, partial [Lachnospiraceae bacterium]|nr:ATP-binding protein [Lachnospiraceae bacterium]
QKTAQISPRNEGDYTDFDGLLYCGKCRTAKQAEVEIRGVKMIMPAMCQCESNKYEIEKQKLENHEKEIRINNMRNDCFPSCKGKYNSEKGMKSWTFQNDKGYNPQAIASAKRFVENFKKFYKDGHGLMFFGDIGVGKSYIAACIANALLDNDYSVLMTDFATIANTISGISNKQGYFESLNSYSLLILDDFASERDTSYMKEIVYTVVNNRINAGLPLLITTNLTQAQFLEPQNMSERQLFSRILEHCYPIHMKGKDLRKLNMIQNFEETKKILGL